MKGRRTIAGVAFLALFLAGASMGTLAPDLAARGPKGVTKIIISKDRAIIDGDTIDVDDLKEGLREIGALDVTIVGDTGDLEDVGITKKRSEIVKFGGDVRVDEDEKVTGAVVVFGGSATIAGVVTDDVVVVGGDLMIEDTADIRGSAVCMGGEITKMPGAKIGEGEVSLGSFPTGASIAPFVCPGRGIGGFLHHGVGLFAGLVWIGLVLLFGAAILFFFPGALERVSATIEEVPVKSGLVGLFGEILLVPLLLFVTLVLCVSIIGIPLLFLVIPLAVFAVIAAFFLGYIGAGVFAGREIGNRAGISLESRYRVMAIGVVAILAFNILSWIVGLGGDTLWPLRAIFGFVGGVIGYLAATVGFGAVIMTKFGTRPFPVARKAAASEPATTGGGPAVDAP